MMKLIDAPKVIKKARTKQTYNYDPTKIILTFAKTKKVIMNKRIVLIGLCVCFLIGIIATVKADCFSIRLKTNSVEQGALKIECKQAEGFCIKSKVVLGIPFVYEQ